MSASFRCVHSGGECAHTACTHISLGTQVEFPERPGALKQFLDAVSPIWNITLFHYRNTGNQSSTVLLGMQVPPGDWERFSSVQESLRGNFAFEELSEDARKVFVKFIA